MKQGSETTPFCTSYRHARTLINTWGRGRYFYALSFSRICDTLIRLGSFRSRSLKRHWKSALSLVAFTLDANTAVKWTLRLIKLNFRSCAVQYPKEESIAVKSTDDIGFTANIFTSPTRLLIVSKYFSISSILKTALRFLLFWKWPKSIYETYLPWMVSRKITITASAGHWSTKNWVSEIVASQMFPTEALSQTITLSASPGSVKHGRWSHSPWSRHCYWVENRARSREQSIR